MLTTITLAQVNYESTNNSVYRFLERMSGNGIIQLNEEIKPFSRMYIAEKLKEIADNIGIRHQKSDIGNRKVKAGSRRLEVGSQSKDKISELEMEDLNFYIREYSSELRGLGFDLSRYEAKKKPIDFGTDYFGFDKYNRFRLFSYDTDQFGIFADPVLSYEYNLFKDGSSWSYSNGLSIHGYLGSHVGFDLKFYDNHPRGDNLNSGRNFSPETGYEFIVGKGTGFDFDRMNASLNFSWNYVTLSIGKDFNYYGSGENGKLILSDKAPSFPNLKLEVWPTRWLRFSYIHGLLNSRILDSTTLRFNPRRNHISTVEKYFVAHMLSITPFKFINFSIGESVIYSDRFQPIYLIPIAFFRFADHYLTDPDENAGNAQLFSSFWYKNYLVRTKFYGSIFIDELSTYNSSNPQAVGYNIGLKSIDPLIPESELTIEYTRINPFVYFHSDSAQTYANYGYEMGHWIGSNADQIYISFTKRILRGLNLNLSYGYVRKGSEEDFKDPRYQSDQHFLWGIKTFYTFYNISMHYEIIQSFFLKLDYSISTIKKEQTAGRNNNSFVFSIGYGL